MKLNQEHALKYIAELEKIKAAYRALMVKKEAAAQKAQELAKERDSLLLRLSVSTTPAEITRIKQRHSDLSLDIAVQEAIANSDVSTEIGGMYTAIADMRQKAVKENGEIQKQARAESAAIRKREKDELADLEKQLGLHPYRKAERLDEEIYGLTLPKSKSGPVKGAEHWQTGVGWTE